MPEMPQPPGSKRDALLALLDRGMVMLHLDARRNGVSVPKYLASEAHLRLNLSYRFLLDDLVIDDAGVSATLSFRGEPHHCKIPWTALFAVTRSGTDEGWLWPNDLPPELVQTALETTDVGPSPAARPSRPTLRSVELREVPPEEGADEHSSVDVPPAAAPAVAQKRDEEDEDDDPPVRPPPFLRLVK